MTVRLFLLVSVFLIIEFYSLQALRTLTNVRWVLIAYSLISVLIIVFIVYQFLSYDKSVGQTKMTMLTLGLLLVTFIPKTLVTSILLLEDVFRFFSGLIFHFSSEHSSGSFLAERRKLVSQIALVIAAIPFSSLIYGITFGRYNYKVTKQTIFFDDLPAAFDGFIITQISDIHCGSFDNPGKINYAIDLINEQNSDMILFTGDIINTDAKEMLPWIPAFKRIRKHKYGKYSVLGNHDYGEYVTWSSEAAKEENFQAVKNLHTQIDFKLLLNEHIFIKKGADKIALIGVENWGHNFKKAGNINQASGNLSKEDFKIVMSHDPSHWEYELKNHKKQFQLTLSGHTHGLQFGIDIPGVLKWSPIQYIYKQWAGLYKYAGKYIYVNRGFGFHAYPGRVGIMPEITVIELKKGKNVA